MSYPPEYMAARDHFHDNLEHMAPFVAEAIATTLVEIEKAPLAGDLLGPSDEEARLREYGRVMQVADEICASTGWNAVQFQILIDFDQQVIREQR